MYDLLKRMLGSGPVYAALGNHDSYNQFVPLRIYITAFLTSIYF